MTEQKLRERSVEVILANQDATGAFVASPNFSQYRYSWLRDGSFIAYSLLLHGQRDSCMRFLRWADATVLRHERRIVQLEEKAARGERLAASDMLPTRFTLAGAESLDDWPNFQIDGYGAWLWCVAQYAGSTGDASVVTAFASSIAAVIRYLSLLWRTPNYDCWEENGTDIHLSTLACVYGGLSALNLYLRDTRVSETAESIRRFVLSQPGPGGAFPKLVGSSTVDASLLWLSVPFGLVDPCDPRMRATVEAIEGKLLQRGGVKRYEHDTYYGGGQWLLLTAWLGWYYARIGRKDTAEECLAWVSAQGDENGDLPEQVLAITNDPGFIDAWRARWGEVAKPLLWSHAMYLVLYAELRDGDAKQAGGDAKLRGATVKEAAHDGGQ